MSRKSVVAAVVLVMSFTLGAKAQQQSAEDLSREAANPVADLMSFPFQNNINGGIGEFDRTANLLNIQPVIPLAGGKFITRTIIPVLWPPDPTSESNSLDSGLGDITLTAFYVPASSGVTWGVGPVIEFPTGGEVRGSEKWSVGPSAVVLIQPGAWTFGALANNVWSLGGDDERDDVNRGLLQYFVVRQLGGGWYLNSAPIITVDWQADEEQRWIVPLGIGAGKVLRLMQLPLNVQAGYYYNVVKPDGGPSWQVRLQAQVLLPIGMFRGGAGG